MVGYLLGESSDMNVFTDPVMPKRLNDIQVFRRKNVSKFPTRSMHSSKRKA